MPQTSASRAGMLSAAFLALPLLFYTLLQQGDFVVIGQISMKGAIFFRDFS